MHHSRFDWSIPATYCSLIPLLKDVYLVLSSDHTTGRAPHFLSAKSLNTCQKTQFILWITDRLD